MQKKKRKKKAHIPVFAIEKGSGKTLKITAGKKVNIGDFQFPSENISFQPHTHLGAAGNGERFTSRHEPRVGNTAQETQNSTPSCPTLSVC